jgi:hypothetical protein
VASLHKRRIKPPDADIERLIDLVRPAAAEKEHCRRFLRDSVELIANEPRRGVAASVVRKRLSALADKLKRNFAEVDDLPQHVTDRVFGDRRQCLAFLQELEFGRAACARGATEPQDGGHRQARREYSRQLIAAAKAFAAILKWGNREPLLTKGGDYFALASLMFEFATGKRDKSVDRTCGQYIKELRQYGWPGKDELRRIRRGDVAYLRELMRQDAGSPYAKTRYTSDLRNGLLRAVTILRS